MYQPAMKQEASYTNFSAEEKISGKNFFGRNREGFFTKEYAIFSPEKICRSRPKERGIVSEGDSAACLGISARNRKRASTRPVGGTGICYGFSPPTTNGKVNPFWSWYLPFLSA